MEREYERVHAFEVVATLNPADNDKGDEELDVLSSPALNWAKVQPVVFAAFVTVSTLLSLAEAVVVSYGAVGAPFVIQVAVLAVSTVLFFVGIHLIQAQMQDEDSYTSRLFSIMCDQEMAFELICFAFSWLTLFTVPGLSALRCIRIFRSCWYFEVLETMLKDGGANGATVPLSIILSAGSQMGLFLRRVMTEIATPGSKGAMVILVAFFYTIYIFAVVYHVELGGVATPEGQSCISIHQCWITMLRLSLYDGTGLDYMQLVMERGHHGLTVLLYVYLIVTAIVLLNGLIGIFGHPFSVDEIEAEKQDEIDRIDFMKSKMTIRSKMHDLEKLLLGWVTESNATAVSGQLDLHELRRKQSTRFADSHQKALYDESDNKKDAADDTSLLIPVDIARKLFSQNGKIFYPFIILALCLSLAEPILVSFTHRELTLSNSGDPLLAGAAPYPEYNMRVTMQPVPFKLQIAVLAASTLLLIIGLVVQATYYNKAQLVLEDHLELERAKLDSLTAKQRVQHEKKIAEFEEMVTKKPTFLRKIMEMIDGEVIFEIILLIYGWLTLFSRPGISVLRCFRVFRMFWYFEIYDLPTKERNPYGVFAPVAAYFIQAVKICVYYLEKAISEVPHKGAIVVLISFFFITYVVAVVMWNAEQAYSDGDVALQCQDINDCFFTLFRLCLFDGNGFDFLNFVINTRGQWGYGALMIVYMCFNSFVLLNGLIGIFGTAFSTGVDEEIEDGGEGDEADNTDWDFKGGVGKGIPNYYADTGDDHFDLPEEQKRLNAQLVTFISVMTKALEAKLEQEDEAADLLENSANDATG